MQTFDIKSMDRWQQMGAGEIVEFKAPAGTRRVKLVLNADEPVRVFVADNPEMTGKVLLASASGIFEAIYSAPGDSYLELEAVPSANIFMCGMSRSQVVGKSPEAEKYTSLEPQGGRTTEFDRMMYYAKLNEKRRDQILAREIEKLRAEMPTPQQADEQLVETLEKEVAKDEAPSESTTTADQA